MNRWLPIPLGIGALGLLELTTLSPLAHSLLVGLYLLYCAFMVKFLVRPGLEGSNEFEDALLVIGELRAMGLIEEDEFLEPFL